jgi:hypothetical protein
MELGVNHFKCIGAWWHCYRDVKARGLVNGHFIAFFNLS